MTQGKPQILITRALPRAVLDRADDDYVTTINYDDTVFAGNALVAASQGMDGLLISSSEQLTAAVIAELADTVGIVATYSVGYEHIDLVAATARGIVVSNTPDVVTDSTADQAMTLMLGAARRAAEADAMVRAGRWVGWTPTHMLGTHITGKRLGIVGMGRIGQAVARRARGFDLKIHYHNRTRLAVAEEAGAVYHADVDSLLGISDFLSLHCPVTPETSRLLNARRIALLPDGAVVVNTARGSIVDDTALIAALKSGKVGAAGLDVYDGEPALNPEYRTLINTCLAPHLGSATLETRNAMGFRALDNLDAFFAGRDPGDRLA